MFMDDVVMDMTIKAYRPISGAIEIQDPTDNIFLYPIHTIKHMMFMPIPKPQSVSQLPTGIIPGDHVLKEMGLTEPTLNWPPQEEI